MSNHLTQDRLSMWIVGQSTLEEQRHVRECLECTEELARFQDPVKTFRIVMQDWAEREPRGWSVSDFLRPRAFVSPSLRWAAIGMAVVMLMAIPLFKLQNDLERQTKAKEAVLLMESVNLHLSRTVPAPMEAVMALIPNDQSTTQSGEVR